MLLSVIDSITSYPCKSRHAVFEILWFRCADKKYPIYTFIFSKNVY